MGIRLNYGGVAIECETPQDAAALVKLLASIPSTNGKHQTMPAAGTTTRAETSISDIVRKLGDRQKQALRHILRASGRLRDSALQEQLGVTGPGLGGILASITKTAEREGVDPQEFFKTEFAFTGSGERYRIYSVPSGAMEEVSDGLGN
jgi:hypothetical protein